MDTEKIKSIAINVIDTEINMIQALRERVDQRFVEAVSLLFACKGHIVVMGMGKSGHIGKKIAATLASTGSPAFFVHPGEAKHGDIGMITPEDIALLISNSGESDEIVAIIPALKRLQIPIIAMTGRQTSTLAKAATVHLDVSVSKEACHLGLAPTASTTVTLVMGDAIAMALSNMKDFSKDDFAYSHPGGTLGKRLLLNVNDIMHKNEDVPMIHENASLKEALFEMTQKKLGMTTIVSDRGALVGILTDGDLRRILNNKIDLDVTHLHHVMTKNPKTIAPGLLAADALALMESNQITSLVVTDPHAKPAGVLHIHDILRAGIL